MNQIPAIIAWSPIIVYFAPVEGRLCFSSVAPTSIIFLVQQTWDECGVAGLRVAVLGTIPRPPFTIYTLNFHQIKLLKIEHQLIE